MLEVSQARPARPSDRKCENEGVRKMEVLAQTGAAEFGFLTVHIIRKYNILWTSFSQNTTIFIIQIIV